MQPTEGRTENNSGQAVNGQIITNGSYSIFVDENGCGYSKCGGVLITRLRSKAWGAFGEDAANASEFGFVPPNGVDFVIANMIPNQVKKPQNAFREASRRSRTELFRRIVSLQFGYASLQWLLLIRIAKSARWS